MADNTDQDYDESVSVGLTDDVEESTIFDLTPLVTEIKDKYEASKRTRHTDEMRWGRAYYNYRGLYGDEVAFTDTEKSKIFVKITKTKTVAAYGQILEVLFADGRLPVTVEPTPEPEGIDDTVHISMQNPEGQQGEEEQPPQEPEMIFGYAGDGQDMSNTSLADRIGTYLAGKFKGATVKEGPGDAKTSLTLEPGKVAAKKMEQKIHDQFVEADIATAIRKSTFECVLLGTGIVKGPFAYEKEYPRWDEEGNYKPKKQIMPRGEHVSLWNFFPDPEANNLDECDYVVQRHKMNKTGLRNLLRRPYFRKSAIDEAIEDGPNYEPLWYEHEIEDSENQDGNETSRWEVLEYWGVVDRDYVEDDLDQEIPEELKGAEEFQINAWVCGRHLLRVVLNPFTPRRIPYQVFPYELNPYNFFGVGLPENMEDCQKLMNGFTRLAVDNAVLAGNVMLEVDENNLVPGQSMKVEPGKIWRRQGGAPGQAIFATKFPSTANENMQLFDKFRQIADDATGLPSYSHGQTGVSGTTRTASGMSMLMGAANLNIKTVVKNLDDYLLKPMGEAYYHFNMQFDFDPDIRGDLDVWARGTASLMQREVKSQRIMQFMQIGANPMLAPFINFEYLAQEAAKTLDLNHEKAVNNPKRAALQARLLGEMGQAGGQGQGGAQGPSMQDPTGTGGGMIGGAGQAFPGQDNFTGNEMGGAPTPGNQNQQPQPPQGMTNVQ